MSSLASRQRGRRLSLGDEPAASPIARAFRRFGAVPRTQRYEMLRLGRAASVSEPRVDDLAAYA